MVKPKQYREKKIRLWSIIQPFPSDQCDPEVEDDAQHLLQRASKRPWPSPNYNPQIFSYLCFPLFLPYITEFLADSDCYNESVGVLSPAAHPFFLVQTLLIMGRYQFSYQLVLELSTMCLSCKRAVRVVTSTPRTSWRASALPAQVVVC